MVLGINLDLIGREITMGGPSTQWWKQLATAVAGGLAFATVLTLLVTPSLLSLRDRHRQHCRGQLGNKKFIKVPSGLHNG